MATSMLNISWEDYQVAIGHSSTSTELNMEEGMDPPPPSAPRPHYTLISLEDLLGAAPSDKQLEASTFIYSRLVLIVISLVGNLTIVCLMIRHSRLRSQHNYLLLNLAASDLLLVMASLQFAVTHLLVSEHEITRDQCIVLQLPLLWALFLTMCSVVPLAHYRVKLIKAYSETSTDFTEAWQFKSAMSTLWLTTFLGALPALLCVHSEATYQKCMLPLLFTDDFLLPFFIFMITVCTMVCGEYFKIMYAVLAGRSGKTMDNQWHKYVKFDQRVTRIVVMMLSTFLLCWWPFLLSIFYFLYPHNNTKGEDTHVYADFVNLFPLVNSSLNPYLHTLSEREFRDTVRRDLRALPYVGRLFAVRRHEEGHEGEEEGEEKRDDMIVHDPHVEGVRRIYAKRCYEERDSIVARQNGFMANGDIHQHRSRRHDPGTIPLSQLSACALVPPPSPSPNAHTPASPSYLAKYWQPMSPAVEGYVNSAYLRGEEEEHKYSVTRF